MIFDSQIAFNKQYNRWLAYARKYAVDRGYHDCDFIAEEAVDVITDIVVVPFYKGQLPTISDQRYLDNYVKKAIRNYIKKHAWQGTRYVEPTQKDLEQFAFVEDIGDSLGDDPTVDIGQLPWHFVEFTKPIKYMRCRFDQISSDQERDIMRLYVDGLTIQEIAEKLCKSKQYISKIVRKYLK